MAARLLPILALALICAGCGGSHDEPRPSGVRTVAVLPDQCALGAAYTDSEVITAFDRVGLTATCGSPELLCTFYLNHDANHSPGGPDVDNDCQKDDLNGMLVDDSGLVESLAVNPADIDRCGATTSAMHFQASNLSMCYGTNGRHGWGAAWEIDFGTQSVKGPIDASAWDGVSFWVKKGTGKTLDAFIFTVVDRFATGGFEETDPATGELVSCGASEPPVQPLPDADANKCDPFAAGITLTDDWSFVALNFSDLRQKGFGMVAPNGLDLTDLWRLQILMGAGDWDFWIDDIAFFRDP